MHFKDWLEHEETLPYAPLWQGMGGVVHVPKHNSKKAITRVLVAASHIDPGIYHIAQVRHADGSLEMGFSGTPDYSAPEEYRGSSPMRTYELDQYENALGSTSDLLPELLSQARYLLMMWRHFKNALIKKRENLGLSPYDNLLRKKFKTDPQSVLEGHKPIVYSVFLRVLQLVTEQFETIDRVLPKVQDNKLLSSFKLLFSKHVQFQHAAYKKLAEPLKQARKAPWD